MASRELAAVLLPGFDGSGRLFAPLLAAGPRGLAPRPVAFAPDEPAGYDDLLPLARAALPSGGRFVLLAESFSAPLAIRLAAERPGGLHALVLAAGFLHRPLHPVLLALPALLAARRVGGGVPAGAVRHLLLGPDAPAGLVEEVRAALARVAPAVLAARAEAALAVDVRDSLARVDAPILFLAPKRDRLFRGDLAEELLAIRPDAEVALLDAPHLVLQRCPHASLGRIEAFLARPGARPGVFE